MNTETVSDTNLATQNQATPFLVGERVTLRTLSRADVPKLLRWVNDPRVNRTLIRGNFPLGWDDEVEWVDRVCRRKEGQLHLGIEVPDLGLIGTMGLGVGSWSDGTAGTGTMIGEPGAWGKGYGTEAKMLLLAHAFRRLNLRRIYSEVYAFNERSLRCQKRCGYVEEGRLRGDTYRDGAYHDKIILVVTRASFEAAEAAWKEKKTAPSGK